MADIHENGFEKGLENGFSGGPPANEFPAGPPNGFHDGPPPNGLPDGPPPGIPGKKFEMPTAKQNEVKLTDYMRESLEKVASAEGFRNYDLKVDHGSAIGDGFVGLIYKVIIQEIDSDKKLSVVLKFPPENQARRRDFGAMDLFKREVFVYNEFLPELVKFQKERHIKEADGFYNFPKCYFAEFNEEKDDSVIIMEDLRENGYKMWDKYSPVNLEHTKLIMLALGKLHALSFALKTQKPELFEKFKSMNDFMTDKMGDEKMAGMMSATVQRAVATIDEKDVKSRNRALRLLEDYSQMMRELTDPKRAEPFTIVGHGDCWSNNFMFQYKVRMTL